MSQLVLAVTDFRPPPAPTESLPRLPALERLLARGRVQPAVPTEPRAWLLGQAGLQTTSPLPLAAMIAAAPGHWAIMTPLNLLAGLERVHLHPRGVPQLAPTEGAALAASFNEVLGAPGLQLQFREPGLCLLSLPRAMAAVTHDPLPLAGCEAADWLPSGTDGAWLRRLMTEAQMLLHEHPLNQARVARGDLPLNALWPWGIGAAPENPLPLPQVIGDDPVLGRDWPPGDTAACGSVALATVLQDPPAPQVVAAVVLGQLARDPLEALARADAEWFRPIEAALVAGRIEQACVYWGGLELHAARRDRWRLWRRPQHWFEAFA